MTIHDWPPHPHDHPHDCCHRLVTALQLQVPERDTLAAAARQCAALVAPSAQSRLLQEATQPAMHSGWRVLAGGCQRRGGQEAYAPLLQALERHIRIQSPAQLRTDLRGCAWLVRLLPELAAGPIEPLPT